jgi:hypothetical protein
VTSATRGFELGDAEPAPARRIKNAAQLMDFVDFKAVKKRQWLDGAGMPFKTQE